MNKKLKAIISQLEKKQAEDSRDKTIDKLFIEQAEQTPGSIALELAEQTLTYSELNRKSDLLTSFLVNKGIKRGNIIAIWGTRSFEMIIAILGILKAGCAYLPLDPVYPEERIQYMLDDSQTCLVITWQNEKKNMQWGKEIINLNDEWLKNSQVENFYSLNTKPDDLAYIIYTSGSTGRPKGVMIEHDSLVNYICWAKKLYLSGKDEIFPLCTSISFDLTVTSLFTPLLSGNKMIIYPEKSSEPVLYSVIRENKVTIIKLTPSHLSLLIGFDLKGTSLRRMVLGGENLKASLCRRIYEESGGRIEIFNEYGPTEATVGCMIYQYDYQRDVNSYIPIGVPAFQNQIYILDDNLKPVAAGTPGEIFISGRGLARGYLNNDELTAAKFIDCDFNKCRKMYRTGDQGQWTTGRNVIEYLGRIDEQVKIESYRVELGEIEAVISTFRNIKNTVVALKESNSGHKYLCAYYVAGVNIAVNELIEYISKSLPGYMIPTHFTQMESLPITLNGKINRNALPEPFIIENNGSRESSLSVLQKLVSLWKQISGIKDLKVTDRLYESGGNSLILIEFYRRINEDFQMNVPVAQLLRYPNVEELSKYLERICSGQNKPGKNVEPKRKVEMNRIRLFKKLSLK